VVTIVKKMKHGDMKANVLGKKVLLNFGLGSQEKPFKESDI
jgi:hypothetical protein